MILSVFPSDSKTSAVSLVLAALQTLQFLENCIVPDLDIDIDNYIYNILTN